MVELFILGGIAVIVLLFNAGVGLFFPKGPWDREAQSMARSMWLAIVAVGGIIASVWFGIAALVAIWPVWVMFIGVSLLAYGVGEWRARRHERQTLDARLAELHARGPLPTWAASIEARRPTAPRRRVLDALDNVLRRL